MPLSVQSSNEVTVNCGSAFLPATINRLASEDASGSGSPSTPAARVDVFEECDHHRNVERLVAVVLIAMGSAALVAAQLMSRPRHWHGADQTRNQQEDQEDADR